MGETATREHWTYGVSLIPVRSGGASCEERVARLVSQRAAQGWQLVSDHTQGDGTRALRFGKVAGVMPGRETHHQTLRPAGA